MKISETGGCIYLFRSCSVKHWSAKKWFGKNNRIFERNIEKNQENFDEFLREILKKNQEKFHKKIGIFFLREILRKNTIKNQEKIKKMNVMSTNPLFLTYI